MIPGETKHFISGSADNSLRFWDCETATTLSKYETKTAVRACGFSYSGTSIMMTTDRQMGHDCFIFIYDIREGILTDFVLSTFAKVRCGVLVFRYSGVSGTVVQKFLMFLDEFMK